MASLTALGGKSPADKKKKPMPSLLMVSIKKDAPDGPPEPADTAPPKPAATPPPAKPDATMGKIKPGTAQFVSQDQTCSTCEYFDDTGNGGVGACKKGVPEADYSTADPTASRCRFYEGNDDATESPTEKAAEGEPEAEAVPA